MTKCIIAIVIALAGFAAIAGNSATDTMNANVQPHKAALADVMDEIDS